jgi:hypothetical protein
MGKLYSKNTMLRFISQGIYSEISRLHIQVKIAMIRKGTGAGYNFIG